ncbi:hypothetical protein T10_9128 [Trichinella papuae]|uniref:Uncharacterized protein n=1 Tax=Trichinella papuae TaxID=268474 RepID=A0A0V1MEK4_9BILA|nr:hypothetical protein T10_9128 [Trichinella papuae]
MACPVPTLIGQSALLARCPIADATCPQCAQRQQQLLTAMYGLLQHETLKWSLPKPEAKQGDKSAVNERTSVLLKLSSTPNSRQKSGTEWLDLYRSTRSPHGTVAAALLEAGQRTTARVVRDS